MKSNRGNVFIAALIFVALALTTAGGLYLWQTRPSQPPAAGITQEPPTAEVAPKLPSVTEVPTATLATTPSTTDETTNWKTYTSKCGLEFKYPPLWKVEPYFISDSENACGYLTGQDYTAGLDSRSGTYITLSRYIVGKDGIYTIDDFVHSTEKVIQPKPDPIKAVDKTYGGVGVKEFTGYGYEPGISAVFLRGNYIYNISRSDQTPEKYIDQILATLRFN